MDAFFRPTANPKLEMDHLWVELTDGILPADMLKHAGMFMIEHDEPGRVMIDLTAYITLLIDMRRI